MGKQTKNPAKIQKKKDLENDQPSLIPDTLSQQYNKFNCINYDSEDDDTIPQPTVIHQQNRGTLPIVDPDNNIDYMIQNHIHSYMTLNGTSGLNVGMGKPLTQTEYDEMRRLELQKGSI